MATESEARARRIEGERELLAALCALNPAIVKLDKESQTARGEYRIWISLSGTPSPYQRSGEISWRTEHSIAIVFDPLYPVVPFETYMADPPLHPNISPDDGFVCLWEDFRPDRTIVEGIIALRNVLTWQSVNIQEEHLMHDEAMRLASRIGALPIPEWPRLRLPSGN